MLGYGTDYVTVVHTTRGVCARFDEGDQRVRDTIVRGNPVIGSLLPRLAALALPDRYLTAGCLFQTVWNALSARESTAGIRDYDVFYCCDTGEVSWKPRTL